MSDLDRPTLEFVANHPRPDFPARSPSIRSVLLRAKAAWKVIIPNVLDIVLSGVVAIFWPFMEPAKRTPNAGRVRFVSPELVKKAKLREKESRARKQRALLGSFAIKEPVLREKKQVLHARPTGNAEAVVCAVMQEKMAVAG